MAPPLGDDDGRQHVAHSRIHYHLGTFIGFAELVFVFILACILSLAIASLGYEIVVLRWGVTDYLTQFWVYMLIVVCLWVASRPIIWLMKAGHKAIERWEVHAREVLLRGEPLPWLQDKILVGLEKLQNVPHPRPHVRDIYLTSYPGPRPHNEPSVASSTASSVDADEEEGAKLTSIAVSVHDDAGNKTSAAKEGGKSSKKAKAAAAAKRDLF